MHPHERVAPVLVRSVFETVGSDRPDLHMSLLDLPETEGDPRRDCSLQTKKVPRTTDTKMMTSPRNFGTSNSTLCRAGPSHMVVEDVVGENANAVSDTFREEIQRAHVGLTEATAATGAEHPATADGRGYGPQSVLLNASWF